METVRQVFDTQQCSDFRFQKGDIFFVHNDMGDGWLWVTAHRTGEQGLVFQDLVENIDEAIDPNQVFNWFHDNITKEEAVDMLVKGIRTFCSDRPQFFFVQSLSTCND